MITGRDIYEVLSALVPLYVAMILAYGSVRWWKIFSPDQCFGINRFVAVFAVPLLSFHFISANDPYTMNFRFIAADSLQKVVVLVALFLLQCFTKLVSLDWSITLFSLSTLPNTLVIGVPLLKAMYGDFSASLMVQIVVLQSVVWYTVMLFLFEYRGAKALIAEQFPIDVVRSIASFRVESDVVSLNNKEPLQADAEVGKDGKLHVVIRRSASSSRSMGSHGLNSNDSMVLRDSDLMEMEIYSLPSSREATPRALSLKESNFFPMSSSKVTSLRAGYNHSLNEKKKMRFGKLKGAGSKSNEFVIGDLYSTSISSHPAPNPSLSDSVTSIEKEHGANKELHMFVWSTSSSPVPERDLRHAVKATSVGSRDDYFSKYAIQQEFAAVRGLRTSSYGASPMRRAGANEELYSEDGLKRPNLKHSTTESPLLAFGKAADTREGVLGNANRPMPSASVVTRLILIMVWRKLIRNPNTYGSIIGLVWSLISFRWNIKLPKIVDGSISILSNTGLGMAMFSLGLFMALQPKIIACGKPVALFSMAVRFLVGPAVMAVASFAIGIRGDLLRVSILQAALPQGIVPFVFAKEYDCHADILSTAVIFGMVVALPITIVYYVLLGLRV